MGNEDASVDKFTPFRTMCDATAPVSPVYGMWWLKRTVRLVPRGVCAGVCPWCVGVPCHVNISSDHASLWQNTDLCMLRRLVHAVFRMRMWAALKPTG